MNRFVVEGDVEDEEGLYIVDEDIGPVGSRIDIYRVCELINEFYEDAMKYRSLCK